MVVCNRVETYAHMFRLFRNAFEVKIGDEKSSQQVHNQGGVLILEGSKRVLNREV